MTGDCGLCGNKTLEFCENWRVRFHAPALEDGFSERLLESAWPLSITLTQIRFRIGYVVNEQADPKKWATEGE